MICSCAPMFKFCCKPPDGASTEYQISNREFFDFLRTYYSDLSEQRVQAGKIFYVVIMGNVTHILPVLHCLKRGIAFVSSLFIYLFIFVNNAHRPSTALVRKLSYFHKTQRRHLLANLDSVYSVFLRKKSHFRQMEQFSKLSLGGATIGSAG